MEDARQRAYGVCAKHMEEPDEAAEAVVKASAHDPELSDLLLWLGAQQIVRTYYADRRRIDLTASSAVERAARSRRHLDFMQRYTLFGRRLLCDARVSDLRESANKRKAMAAGNFRRARFENALADAMGDSTKTVGSFFTNAQIVKIGKKCNVG